MFTPVMFFLNLGLACFIAALPAALGWDLMYQVLTFAVFAAVFLLWLRPFLIQKKNGDKPETIEMYAGKTAKVIETVTAESGRIAVFGEEWQAKLYEHIIKRSIYEYYFGKQYNGAENSAFTQDELKAIIDNIESRWVGNV